MLQKKNGEKLRIDCLPNRNRWKTNEEGDNCKDEKNNNFCFEHIHLYFFTGQIIFYCRKILKLSTQLIRRGFCRLQTRVSGIWLFLDFGFPLKTTDVFYCKTKGFPRILDSDKKTPQPNQFLYISENSWQELKGGFKKISCCRMGLVVKVWPF